MSKLVKIKMHGVLAEQINSEWNLAVKSVGEAVHAINTLTNNRFYKVLNDNDLKQIKYHVLINGQKVQLEKPINETNVMDAADSELALKIGNLETIDFIPIIEGTDKNILSIILGAVLIVVGVILVISGGGSPLGVALIIGGLGLVAAGVINLLSKPPKFEDFREISGGKKVSYFFSGPENTTKEGGPVPVGYGRLLAGSQVISASYDVSQNSVDGDITI